MRNKKFNKIILLILFVLFFSKISSAKISESELKNFSESFLSKVVEDNPSFKSRIHECLSGIIKDGSAGMRLLDKFALFMYDINKQGVSINKIKFFYNEGIYNFFIILQDDKDKDQLYTFYLEYEKKEGQCFLKDIYFSLVFKERMKAIKKFFESR